MEDKYIIYVMSQDNEIVALTQASEDCPNIENVARSIKACVDYRRQLDEKPFTECVEVWVRENPRSMYLLATFF